MLLRRTSYPCRFSDMIQRFPRPVSVLSLITNEVMDFIYDNHCHLVTQWNRDVLSSAALQQYAETISRKGSPLNNCFGFIDGTVRPISRPGNGQRTVYNGNQRVYGLISRSAASFSHKKSTSGSARLDLRHFGEAPPSSELRFLVSLRLSIAFFLISSAVSLSLSCCFDADSAFACMAG